MEHISENVDDNDKQQPLERNKVNVKENDWIVVVYSGKWYVGQVLKIDNDCPVDSDRSDLCFTSSHSLSDNDLCILHSYFVLRRQYIAGNSTIRSLCIFALDS
jgi:hypothetical protein